MTYIVLLLSIMFVLGVVGVSSKPSPVFGGVSLIIGGGAGCGLIVSSGGSFLGLMVFLVYLGGMLVVFGYTTAMATEEYPEAWTSSKVVLWGVIAGVFVEFVVLVFLVSGFSCGGCGLVLGQYSSSVVEYGVGGGLVRIDSIGSSVLYGLGSWLMLISAWVLFVSIFIIIEVVRGV
uniref:NADH dehydrogenase subunit 6 n=1 Tax=Macroscelides flavicaudatus TaxID=432356 RepID=UPI002435CCF3|nr:NADH dehydrogenase subunit 6 [Macroscelides flavicaudatus]WEW63444.1 NADH dehydrogenase subunit 6 [Macroscelides flavicaudatus]